MSPTVPAASASRTQLALTILRVALGLTFVAHGYQKLFEFGIPAVTSGFIKFGVPFPAVVAPLDAIVEFAAGLALALGWLTRLAALGILIIMIGAVVIVHIKHGYIGPMGAELPTILGVSALVLILAGGGAWSLDATWMHRRAA